MERMRIGSLFDGSGTAPLAATMLGWEPVWASEVEPFPVAVTRARFPNMKHLGDITEINGEEIPPVDVIVGGSPCQDLSVAGKQAGLTEGTRSNMFYEMMRIVREMRGATNGKYPRFVVWENVPGAFSSNQGRDFHEVVKAFCAIADDTVSIPEPQKDKRTDKLIWRNAGCIVGDGWSFAWRVLDAQYWGVPQRRRRIFAVLDFGSERAGEILFERTGVRGDIEPGGAKGEGTPADAVGRADRGGGVRCLNPHDTQTIRQYDVNGIYPALTSNATGGLNRQGVVYAIDALSSNSMKSSNPQSGFHEENYVKCLDTSDCNPCKNQGGNVIVQSMPDVVYPAGVVGSLCARADSSPCIDRGQPFVAMFSGGQGEKARSIGYSEDAAPTLRTTLAGGNAIPQTVYALQGNGIDRALTAGCNGAGWREGEMYTLNTIDRPAVVYDARGNGNGDVAATITGDHQNRITDYTNIAVKENDSQKLYAMQAFGHYEDAGVASAQLSRQYKDATDIVVERKPRRYIVRRLTPTECARLQGFPDWWCDGIGTPDPTEDDVEFWTEVFETHRQAINPSGKPKSRNQIVKWVKNPHSDTAKYKMWGNGMALPCMLAVLGAVDQLDKEED